MPQLRFPSLVLCAILVVLAACSGDDEVAAAAGSGGGAGRAGTSAGRGGTGGAAVSGSGGQADANRPGLAGNVSAAGSGGSSGASGPGKVCAKTTTEAKLQPVYLVFAFDVSGSMGKGDKPWHDRSLKWDPVVQATRSFFEDPKSEGLSASLTFFPADGGEDARCEVDSYLTPDVAMQGLPANAFGAALDTIGMEDWRGGTPTQYVVQGVLNQIDAAQAQTPGRYVIVLVTDGYPQDCDEDSIEAVAELVKQHAAKTPTYVIGVANPPIDDAPDVTTNLRDIAVAGGTDQAYVIDTGDPAKTVSDFKETIEGIRSASLSCNVEIPAPPAGETFDKTKVSVSVASGATTSKLGYASDCKGTDVWHYDDPDQPKELVLCPDTCTKIQSDPMAQLSVAFECDQVITGPL
jgi:hypothetical protein